MTGHSEGASYFSTVMDSAPSSTLYLFLSHTPTHRKKILSVSLSLGHHTGICKRTAPLAASPFLLNEQART